MIPANSVGQLTDLAQSRIDDEPTGPVKILRRPKPQSGDTRSNQLGSQSLNNETNGTSSLSPQHPVADAGSWCKSSCTDTLKIKSSPSIYDEEWPSIADASKCQGSHRKPQQHQQQQQQRLSVMKKPESSLKTHPQKDVAQKSSNHNGLPPSNPGYDSNNTVRSTATVHSQSRPKGPVKTYKERADDYAKARLRILGSAFSEDEQRDNVAFR